MCPAPASAPAVPLLQVTFSDDSDLEAPAAGGTPTASCKPSCPQRARSPRPTRSKGSSQGLSTRRSCAQPRRGRPGTRRAAEEKRERVPRRAASKRAEEEWELPRATEAAEKMEEELQISFEVLQDSEEEARAPGELGCPRIWGDVAFMPPYALAAGCPQQSQGPGISVPPHRQEAAASAQAGRCRQEAQAAGGW